MSEHAVTVVAHPAKRLAGIKVKTTVHKAAEDCPALWQTFGPRINELFTGGECKGAYGLSAMLNDEDFYYWAAVEISNGNSVPPGLEEVRIPAGQYASCLVPNLEKLAEAYMHVYGTWLGSQAEYSLNEQAPCFEHYPPNWQMPDAFEVFMPVKKR